MSLPSLEKYRSTTEILYYDIYIKGIQIALTFRWLEVKGLLALRLYEWQCVDIKMHNGQTINPKVWQIRPNEFHGSFCMNIFWSVWESNWSKRTIKFLLRHFSISLRWNFSFTTNNWRCKSKPLDDCRFFNEICNNCTIKCT